MSLRSVINRSGAATVGLLCLAVLSGLAELAASGQVPCYEVSAVIAAPPRIIPANTFGTGISPNGEYVVGYFVCGGGNERGWAYRTATQQFSILPMPPGISIMFVWDVNDAGLAVGRMGGTAGAFAFVFDLNTSQFVAQIQAVVTTGGNGAGFTAINAQGVACGTRTISLNPTRDNAFTWSAKEGVVDLGLYKGASTSAVDLNDSGWLTGRTMVNGINTPFIFGEGQWILLGSLANLSSFSTAINNRLQVVGGSQVPNPAPPPASYGHACAWSNGARTDLGTLPAPYDVSEAYDISNEGVAVGFSRWHLLGASQDRGVIWRDGLIHDVNSLVVDRMNLVVSALGSISSGGAIAGYAQTSSFGYVGIVLVPAGPSQADIDRNCRVNIDDLLNVINEWGREKSPADLDGDGFVGIGDLIIVIENWTVLATQPELKRSMHLASVFEEAWRYA